MAHRTHSRGFWKTACLLMLLVVLQGCASNRTIVPVAVAPATLGIEAAPPSEYYLRIGDTLSIKFFGDANLNENVIIRPDGKISLQLIGELKAAGVTPFDLRQTLVAKYTGILRNPEITVIVREFTRGKIYIGGDVTRPGEMTLTDRISALQAIMYSGGFTHGAERSNVVILRNRGTTPTEFISIDLNAQLEGQRQTDIYLEPSDIVYVPRTGIASVAQFFDDYINKILPIYKNMGLSLNYNLGGKSSVIVRP